MKKVLPHILIALAASVTSFAMDTVVFKNGDVLTGTILKQDNERVYFKSGAFGSVSLDTHDIAEIRIETPGLGEVAVPSAALTPPNPDQPATEVVVVAPTVSTLTPPAPEATKWAGQAGLAVAMRESNTLRRSGDTYAEQNQSFETYRVYGNVNWLGIQNNLKWDWTYRYSQTDLRKEDDFFNMTQVYQHNFTKKYYSSAKSVYQHDYRRGIDDEYLQTAELGVNWFTPTNALQLSTSVGGGYHQYDRIGTPYSNKQGTLVIDESLRWQLINSLTLFQKYTHLGNFDQYHFVLTSGLENQLIRDIFLRIEYRLDRDTQVDYNDKSYYDKALLTSVLYKF